LQLQLPSLTLPQFCADAAGARQTATPNTSVAKPNHFIAPSIIQAAAARLESAKRCVAVVITGFLRTSRPRDNDCVHGMKARREGQ
jgi:hypothetical protein